MAVTCKGNGGEANPSVTNKTANLLQPAAEKAKAAIPRARLLKGRQQSVRTDAQRPKPGHSDSLSPLRKSSGDQQHQPAGAIRHSTGRDSNSRGVLVVHTRPTSAPAVWVDASSWAPEHRPMMEVKLTAGGAESGRRRLTVAVGPPEPEVWPRGSGRQATSGADAVRVGGAARAGPAGRQMPVGREAPPEDPAPWPAGLPMPAGLGFRSQSLETLITSSRGVSGLLQSPEYASGPVSLPWVTNSRGSKSKLPSAQRRVS